MQHADVPKLIVNAGFTRTTHLFRRKKRREQQNLTNLKVPFDCDLDNDQDHLKLRKWLSQQKRGWQLMGFSLASPTQIKAYEDKNPNT